MMNLRILFLNGGGLGGAQMMTVLYANILQKAGFQCKILTRTDVGDDPQYLDTLLESIKHTEVQCRFRKYPLYVFKEIWIFRPDIVFVWNSIVVRQILNRFRKYHLTPSFKMVCRCPNTPSVMDEKESAGLVSFRDADMVIAQTEEMAQELHTIVGIDSRRIVTIYNPINKERIYSNIQENFPFDKSYTNYVATGRISEQKDYPTMLKAFALVVKNLPMSRLYILGKDPSNELTSYLLQIIKENNLQHKVFFEGFQSNPHKYVKDADAFVLSSIYEGLPNAMLDAMYLGIPVVATTCIPYIAQVVHDGENGYTCPVKDSKALSEAMLKAVRIKRLKKYEDINNSEKLIIKFFHLV